MVEELNEYCANTLNTSLGIEFTEVSKESVVATMPVDERTIQPMGILNGGASMALVEIIASAGANLLINRETQVGYGLEINGNHVKPAFQGETVKGVGSAIHVGNTTQVWEVKIFNKKEELVNISRMTIAVRPRPKG